MLGSSFVHGPSSRNEICSEQICLLPARLTGFYMVLLRRAVGTDHNRAAGVVFGDPGDELRVFFQ